MRLLITGNGVEVDREIDDEELRRILDTLFALDEYRQRIARFAAASFAAHERKESK